MSRGAKPKQYPQSMVQAVRTMYADNLTQHEIAAELGTTQKVIFNLMRRHGIEARVAAKGKIDRKSPERSKGDQ